MAVAEAWSAAAVRFVVLRNYSGLPQIAGSDLDVLVAHEDLGVARSEMLAAASSLGFVLVNVVRRAASSPVNYTFYHHDLQTAYGIDMNSQLAWHGLPFLSESMVIARRKARHPLFVPHPVDEACVSLLTRLLYQGHVDERYKKLIGRAVDAYPLEFRSSLEAVLGKRGAEALVRLLAKRRWAEVESKRHRLRLRLITGNYLRHPFRPVAAALSETRRVLRRMVWPPGLLVVFVGPDGSGKTAVGDRTLRSLEPVFSGTRRIHWKPRVLRLSRRGVSGTAPEVNPHGRVPRRGLIGLLHFGRHWLEFTIFSNTLLPYWLFKNFLVVVDRYYPDIFVDPRRYRLDVPVTVTRLGYLSVRRPDLLVCLDAPVQVLRARKREVTEAETSRQRRAYVDMAKATTEGRVVDASVELDRVVGNATALTLTYLKNRTARELQRRG